MWNIEWKLFNKGNMVCAHENRISIKIDSKYMRRSSRCSALCIAFVMCDIKKCEKSIKKTKVLGRFSYLSYSIEFFYMG